MVSALPCMRATASTGCLRTPGPLQPPRPAFQPLTCLLRLRGSSRMRSVPALSPSASSCTAAPPLPGSATICSDMQLSAELAAALRSTGWWLRSRRSQTSTPPAASVSSTTAGRLGLQQPGGWWC